MKIRPQDWTGNPARRMQHVVVIVQVDPDIEEAQHVPEEDRQEWSQSLRVFSARHFHLEHHDCDDDGDHTVTECFESTLAHRSPSVYLERATSQESVMNLRRIAVLIVVWGVFGTVAGTCEAQQESVSKPNSRRT